MPSLLLKTLPLGMLLALLTSCGAVTSSPAVTRTVNPCRALPLAVYSRGQQAHVADEIGAAAPDAMWPRFIRDYGALRSAVRACQGVR